MTNITLKDNNYIKIIPFANKIYNLELIEIKG